MSNAIQVITTGDGSHSLLNTALDETYHSRHGAVQESIHVFIKEGLEYFLRQHPATSSVSIFEVGFGTGLNALLTAASGKSIDIHYASVETYPLQEQVWATLNYAHTDHERALFKSIHQAPWNECTTITEHFHLEKIHTTVQAVTIAESSVNIVFFDAFAPNKQPDMWTIDVLSKMFEMLAGGGVFVTYCAKGQLKRDLKSVGFHVETLAGPPGKKEMVRALKI